MSEKITKKLFDALRSLHRAACEYEEIDNPKLSQALNKSFDAMNSYVESPTASLPQGSDGQGEV